jgi:uncharacterized membrane protein
MAMPDSRQVVIACDHLIPDIWQMDSGIAGSGETIPWKIHPLRSAGMDKIIAQGRLLFAIAIAAFGVEHLVIARSGGTFLPVIPWVPANPILAYLVGTALVAAGVSIAVNAKTRLTTALLGIFFLACVVLLQIPKVAEKPLDIGFRTTFFETLSIGATALTLAAALPPASRGWQQFFQSGRYLFAVSSVVFGIDHLLIPRFIASLIPSWIPGPLFWAYFTGFGFIAAGICIAAKWMDRWAAALLGTMFLLWFLLLHVPRISSPPRSHNPDEWSSALIALALGGASWVMAWDSLHSSARTPQLSGAGEVKDSSSSLLPHRGLS